MTSGSHSEQADDPLNSTVVSHSHVPHSAAFSFVCLGVGGGPFENDSSCYVMKPADRHWHDGAILVEGGSFLGSLRECLEHPDHAFSDATFPPHLTAEQRTEVFNSWITQVYISHGHLDHVFGLALASANSRTQRPVYGLPDTLDSILGLFNGRLWPRLASYDAEDPMTMYHLRSLELGKPLTATLDVTVTPYPVSHGASRLTDGVPVFQDVFHMPPPSPLPCAPLDTMSTTVSTAFLFRNHRVDRDVLFLGDVEPDEVGHSRANAELWRKVAGRMAQGKLNAVFLECSYSSEQPNHLLFGHLTPKHLYAELKTLARLVAQERFGNEIKTKNALRGLKCVVIHIKGMVLPADARFSCFRLIQRQNESKLILPVTLAQIVEKELQALEAEHQLGVEFIIARRGQRIGAYGSYLPRMLIGSVYHIN
ncbi:3',5'-cyclic-nucleotide phosphodiesterase [Malassezia equina]|uniref:3',5'-cyclic-nucleotide phosphodiesterase n=1 Tax=Malassezia equina TaxID=1381935 RepID=A0AAF0J2I0_9BASI|nr:3',5'-cyclic-nucleotide phosphodiesterase [Malassezia equina]